MLYIRSSGLILLTIESLYPLTLILTSPWQPSFTENYTKLNRQAEKHKCYGITYMWNTYKNVCAYAHIHTYKYVKMSCISLNNTMLQIFWKSDKTGIIKDFTKDIFYLKCYGSLFNLVPFYNKYSNHFMIHSKFLMLII